jgi:hypothetical protein
MIDQAAYLWSAITENPWALSLIKVLLVLIVGVATVFGFFILHVKITRELARWIWGYVGVALLIAGPIVAVVLGGSWWYVPPITALLLALYVRVDYRDEGLPTTWTEVAGSYRWRGLGYGDLKGPAVIAAVPDSLIHDEMVKPALRSLTQARVKESLAELEELAASGSVAAMNNLGVIHEAGLGDVAAKREALKWYRKAAEADAPIAQYNLGMLLAGDHLISHSLATMARPAKSERSNDFIESHRLFSAAARQGFKPARKALKNLQRHMTPEEIAAAQSSSP